MRASHLRKRPDVRFGRFAFVALLLLGLWALTGCCGNRRCFLKKGYPEGRWVIQEVVVAGNQSIPTSELLAGLASARSPRFLGLAPGVALDYEVFDETLLARDTERIERMYRSRGFYEAKVRAARAIKLDQHRLRVELEIAEGPADPWGKDPSARVMTRRVTLAGIERLPLDEQGNATLATTALRSVKLRPCVLSTNGECSDGDPFDETKFEDSKTALAEDLANRGCAFVKVTGHARVDVARHVADVTYEIDPGPLARFGPIQIEGLQEIPEAKVRAQLSMVEGRRYSRAKLRETQTTLTALGHFSNVELREDLSRPDLKVVPVRVILKEGRLRGIRAGVGASFDVLKLSNSLLASWEDRNFLGGMRELRIEDRFSLTYYPLRVGRKLEAPSQILPENFLRTTLRQPSFLERRTVGILRGDINVYPVLYRLGPGVDPNQERIIGFLELRGAAGLERPIFRRHLVMGLSYSWGENWPVRYHTVAGGDPAGLGPVRVVYPELVADIDFRDNPMSPRNGFRFINSLQVAGALGLGDVADLRLNPDLRAYYQLLRGMVLALRLSVGLLLPSNYGQSLRSDTTLAPDSGAAIADQAKLLFRVFYSGGANSNRGYPYHGIGPHGPLGFLQPATVECSFNPAPGHPNPEVCNRPLGGLTLWEASLEVRVDLIGALGGVAFVDASDVRRDRASFRFTSPHLSPGLGLRYGTPVGPLRMDVAYRALQTVVKDDPATPTVDERAQELAGEPIIGNFSRFLPLPIALSLSLGQAF